MSDDTSWIFSWVKENPRVAAQQIRRFEAIIARGVALNDEILVRYAEFMREFRSLVIYTTFLESLCSQETIQEAKKYAAEVEQTKP